MRVSDVFLSSYQPNNDLDADLISDLRDLRKLAREILRDSGPASEPLFDRMVPKAGWNALKAHLEEK